MDLFKLIGTIAIDNTEAKEKLKETSEEGSKAESKLSKLGAGAAKAGKVIASGLAAGAGAVAAIGGAAIKSYAEYEQLVGGVETLFGTRGAKSVEEYAATVGKSVDYVSAEFDMLKQAEADVMSNASQAYKTAGLSVNEYMESVNSMAAALNQSSASQLESAELANMAVIDMSDNANKMGTSMEAIQNAYAGFTKQNFTMLDNLKLGYGGTKEEMQRLLKDAEAISGIKYDISSFADITQAIHVMQEEMGIAGTTANEASTTIQGSFGMLKSSWENLLTGLSDPSQDLTALINNVFESVTTLAGNLIPRITEVLKGIATAVQTLVPMLAAELPNLFNQLLPPLIEGATALINGLVSALPGVLSAIISAAPMLIDAFVQVFNTLVASLPEIINMLVSALPALIPALIDGVVSMVMAIVENLPTIIQALVDALPVVITTIVEAVVSNLPILISGAVQLISGLAAALPDIFMALVETVSMLFSSLIDGVKNLFAPIKDWFSQMWQSLGSVPGLAQLKTMVETIFTAIKTHITTVQNAIKTVFSTAWNSIKDVVSTVINSIKNVIQTSFEAIKTIISNVMKLITSVLKGDWEGVKDAISNILNAIKSVIQSVWDGIKNTITSVLNGIKNTVSSIFEGIKSVISSTLNTAKTVVTSAWNGMKSAISTALNGIKTTVKTGFNEVVSFIKTLPDKVKNVGKNLVEGIWNGISNSLSWIKGKIKGWVGDVTSFIKNLFGIKSPSRVMRDEVGKQLAEGVAVGITENAETVENAADKMAQNVLSAAQKRLDDYKVYNELTLADEVAFWDSVREQVTAGTSAKIEADKKYFEAKKKLVDEEKSLNQQLVEAGETLQKKLNDIADKFEQRVKSIVGSFKLFGGMGDKYEMSDLLNGTYKADLFSGLEADISDLEDWTRQTERLKNKIGDTDLYKEIYNSGFDALPQIRMLNSLSETELQKYVELYDKKMQLATSIASSELEKETLNETKAAYQEFADKCSELGVKIVESFASVQLNINKKFPDVAETINSVGKTMVETWTLIDNALSKTFAKVIDMHEQLSGEYGLRQFAPQQTFDFSTGTFPGLKWHASAVNSPRILDKPTIFGYSTKSGSLLGGGEAGSELIGGVDTVKGMIQDAVSSENRNLENVLYKILQALLSMDSNMGGHLREALESMSLDVNKREFARLVKAVN